MIILCLRDMKRHAGLRWVIPQRSVMADVLRYGLRYHLARIGNNVDVRIGVVLLGILAPSAKVGFFAVASALMMRVLLISDAVAAPLLPRAARDALGRPALVGVLLTGHDLGHGGCLDHLAFLFHLPCQGFSVCRLSASSSAHKNNISRCNRLRLR